jgi:galactosylceramidase
MAPNRNDYSIVIESSGAKALQRLQFKLSGGLSNKPLQVWRTNGREQFAKLEDVARLDASLLEITVEPDSVYSLTTTIGQRKGGAKPPPPTSFPSKYKEDFAGYTVGSMPKYWSDFGGVFEVVKRSDGKGNALRQVLERNGI